MENFTFESICDVHTENIRVNSKASRVSNPEVMIHPSRCVMPSQFKDNFSKVYNFEVFPDDTWVVTYPKSGTTWSQEMVWLLRNNLDYETAKSIYLKDRFPFLESVGSTPSEIEKNKLSLTQRELINKTDFRAETIVTKDNDDEGGMSGSIAKATNLKRPRCVKSHLPLELLPEGIWTVKPKIIYVSRDPRDVAISYYHHNRLWNGYQGTLEDFTEGFLADRHVYSPFWSHNLSFWTLEDKSHVLINSYEDMKRDLVGVIRKTANFLEVDINDEQVNELKEHLTFDSMKKNNQVNYLELAVEVKKNMQVNEDELVFMRKGESGGWRNTYAKEMIGTHDRIRDDSWKISSTNGPQGAWKELRIENIHFHLRNKVRLK